MSKTPKPMPAPSIGRIVHFVLNAGQSLGQHRPAIIVRTWENSNCVQLQVLLDRDNDCLPDADFRNRDLIWQSSVAEDQEAKKPGTWHWPETI